MRTCRVKPSLLECRMCISAANFANSKPPCSICDTKNKVYELLECGTDSKSGDYAVVVYNGRAAIVDLDRVFDIKTTEGNPNDNT